MTGLLKNFFHFFYSGSRNLDHKWSGRTAPGIVGIRLSLSYNWPVNRAKIVQ
jgi:hypothetical protein